MARSNKNGTVRESGKRGLAGSKAGRGMTWTAVQQVAHRFPGVVDSTSYGTPALFAGKKLIARFREDGESVVVRTDPVSRDFLLGADPRMYFLTDHYRDFPWILVRLTEARVTPLTDLLEAAWRLVAGKRAIAEYDADQGGSR